MRLLERLEKGKMVQSTAGELDKDGNDLIYFDKYADLKEQIHEDVIELVNAQMASQNGDNDNIDLHVLIEQLINENDGNVSRNESKRLAREIYDDVVGLGPLESLLNDETVSEIMVNGA